MAWRIVQKLLYPPVWVLIFIPILSFAALIMILGASNSENALAYLVYGMSAYSLTIVIAALPGLIRRIRSSRLLRRAAESELTGRYFNDLSFRGSVSLYRGMAVNFFYCIFRVAAGLRYTSVWFFSMAVYYLVLGGLRLYLTVCYHRRTPAQERRCYRKTAWLLLLLNIPMGGMIVQMIWTNSGFSYPGYIIYLSALYTFYAMGSSIRNLVRFRRLGSPILSAARVLNFVSAMMSILGLQTAMISRFSENGESYRRMMNAITGGFVYGAVILLAFLMLLRSRVTGKEAESVE